MTNFDFGAFSGDSEKRRLAAMKRALKPAEGRALTELQRGPLASAEQRAASTIGHQTPHYSADVVASRPDLASPTRVQTAPTTTYSVTPEMSAYMQEELARTALRNQQQAPVVRLTQGSVPVGPTTVPTTLQVAPVVEPKVPTTTPFGQLGPAAVAGPQTQTPTGAIPAGSTPAAAGPIQNQAEGAQGSPGLQGITSAITAQLQAITSQLSSPSATPDVSAVFMKQAASILTMLDEQEKDLRAEHARSGQMIDPATRFTIDQLRERLEDDLKTVREDLNRRGLYESGILLELENRLQKGSASNEARIMAERLSKLQEDLRTGLGSIRQQRVSTLGTFGLAGANAAFQSSENTRRLTADREQSLIRALLDLRGQEVTQSEGALSRAAQGENLRTQIEAAARQGDLNRASELQRQLSASQAAMERAQYEAQQAAARQGTMTEYQRQQLELERQRLAQGGYQGGISKANTDRAVADAQKFSSMSDAMAWLQQNAAAMQASGVDISALQAWIRQNLPDASGGGSQLK